MKKILITWGGWDGHEPEQTAKIMAEVMQNEGFEVDLTATLEVFDNADELQKYDLIVPVWTMSEITPERSKNLRDAILSGVGLAGWHGGMGDAFRKDTEYQFMVGGQWGSAPR